MVVLSSDPDAAGLGKVGILAGVGVVLCLVQGVELLCLVCLVSRSSLSASAGTMARVSQNTWNHAARCTIYFVQLVPPSDAYFFI